MPPLLTAEGLCKYFPMRRGLLRQPAGVVRAVDGVSLSLEEGETFALVGESGSGKTTLGRCLIRLVEPTAGRLLFRGRDLLALGADELRRERRHFQMIFQDSYASLNPRFDIERTLSEPLEIHHRVPRSERARRVKELLDMVGLPRAAVRRYPHEFSGGQRQRIGIARALATEPELLIADEPVSALDVSVQAQMINLLTELQRRLQLAMVFIGHDLSVVEQIADRVAVLYLGRLVEVASVVGLFSNPRHPYTVSLMSAIPIADPESGRKRLVLPGEPPSPASPPAGCRFHTRCPIAKDFCKEEEPELREEVPGHWVACHFPGELGPSAPWPNEGPG